MDKTVLSPVAHLHGYRAYGRAADGAAWRMPTITRFSDTAANDVAPRREPTLSEMADGIPGWLTVVLGGVVAALAGALLGGALHI